MTVRAFSPGRPWQWGGPELRREGFQIGARRFVLISWRNGPWELYEREASGLECFLGYAPEAMRELLQGLA